jgi:asparagine N-glycosylation enzyme membrane subunit Stt3
MTKLKPEAPQRELGSQATIIFMACILGIALILRVVYPFKSVFGFDFVNFLETDAWNRMGYAQSMSHMNFFESIGYMAQHNLLFSWVVSVFGRVFPIEQVGAWLPPVIALGVIVTVYFIGKSVFSRNVGLVGALFVAVIPSEFLHRSLLGFADHHALEVLIISLFILFLIKTVQSGKVLSKWTLLSGLTICLYALNWKSGLYVLGIFVILVIVALVVRNLLMRETWHAGVLPIVALGIIGLALYLPMGGYRQLFYFMGVDAAQATTTGEVVSTLLSPVSQRTISEIMPLLQPYGQFSLIVVVSNLLLFSITFLVGLIYLWEMRKDKLVVVFAVFSLFMLAMTLNERRFLYYLTLNIGILSAFAIFEIARRLKGNVLANAMVFMLPMVIITLPFAKSVAGVQVYQMTEEWHQALVWLKYQPAGVVSAWSDYGHWITYVSDKTPNYLPGPGGILIAKAFLSETGEEAKPYLDEMKTTYFITDDQTLQKKYQALQSVAGEVVPVKDTIFYKIMALRQYPTYLELVYESPTLKIFKYRG